MIDDEVGPEGFDSLPLRIEEMPHQRAHVLEELEARCKAFAARECRLAFWRVDERQKLSRQSRVGNTPLRYQRLVLFGICTP